LDSAWHWTKSRNATSHNIQKSGKSLLEMINDILDLGQIESGKDGVRLSDFRIDQLIAAQCDMFRNQTERKNIDLETDIERGLPEMFQDQVKVRPGARQPAVQRDPSSRRGGRIIVAARRTPRWRHAAHRRRHRRGHRRRGPDDDLREFRQGKSASPAATP